MLEARNTRSKIQTAGEVYLNKDCLTGKHQDPGHEERSLMIQLF